jgi:hypothetical protein
VRLPRCALRQQSLREFIVDAATPQLLQERTIATLPRPITRIEQRLSEPLVIYQADFNEARDRSTHMLFWVAGGDQALFKTLA